MVNSHRKFRVGKTQLIKEVGAALNVSDEQVKLIVDNFLKQFANHLSQGESVTLSHDGLGRFDVVKAAPRVGRNVRTGQTLSIPSRMRVRFVPAVDLKNVKRKKE